MDEQQTELFEYDSQEDKILYHLKHIGNLTPIDALNLYGCFRLGARIYDLRKQGHKIKMELEKNNGKCYARYSL